MDIKHLIDQIIGVGAFVGLQPDLAQRDYMERRIEELVRGVIGRELQDFNKRANAACERQVLSQYKAAIEQCAQLVSIKNCGCSEKIRELGKGN